MSIRAPFIFLSVAIRREIHRFPDIPAVGFHAAHDVGQIPLTRAIYLEGLFGSVHHDDHLERLVAQFLEFHALSARADIRLDDPGGRLDPDSPERFQDILRALDDGRVRSPLVDMHLFHVVDVAPFISLILSKSLEDGKDMEDILRKMEIDVAIGK